MAKVGDSGLVRILLIEDNDGDVFLLSMALKEAAFPHSLTTIRDGGEAMQILRGLDPADGSVPDLILLDLNLPCVDGATIIDLLRSRPELREIPVILLSSSRSPQDIARAEVLKNSMFIVKPSDLEAFLEIGCRARDFLQQVRQPIGSEQADG